jgi:hypothetical protein
MLMRDSLQTSSAALLGIAVSAKDLCVLECGLPSLNPCQNMVDCDIFPPKGFLRGWAILASAKVLLFPVPDNPTLFR